MQFKILLSKQRTRCAPTNFRAGLVGLKQFLRFCRSFAKCRFLGSSSHNNAAYW
jgi:hypothetical protein